jgi:hypothetical protein
VLRHTQEAKTPTKAWTHHRKKSAIGSMADTQRGHSSKVVARAIDGRAEENLGLTSTVVAKAVQHRRRSWEDSIIVSLSSRSGTGSSSSRHWTPTVDYPVMPLHPIGHRDGTCYTYLCRYRFKMQTMHAQFWTGHYGWGHAAIKYTWFDLPSLGGHTIWQSLVWQTILQ